MSSVQVCDLSAKTGAEAEKALYALLHSHRDQPLQLQAAEGFRLSSGIIQLLLVAAADWQERGLSLTLSGLSPDQHQLFDMTGLSSFLATAEAGTCP